MSKIDDFIGFVSFNQPLPSLHSEKRYWLNDGEIIRFTNRKVTSSNNAEYEINGDPYVSIYFSQLECKAVNKQLNAWGCKLFLKDGSQKNIYELNESDFWNIVKGKTFQVDIFSDVPFVINPRSKKLKMFVKYNQVLEFVRKCFNEDRFEDIEDLLLKRNVYALTEI